MEITNEIKAKAFAQYLYQKLNVSGEYNILTPIELNYWYERDFRDDNPEVKLILKPLSDITDEDAIEVAKICRWNHISDESKIFQVKELLDRMFNGQTNLSGTDWLKVFQYLQCKSYDLPQYLVGNQTLHKAGLATYE